MGAETFTGIINQTMLYHIRTSFKCKMKIEMQQYIYHCYFKIVVIQYVSRYIRNVKNLPIMLIIKYNFLNFSSTLMGDCSICDILMHLKVVLITVSLYLSIQSIIYLTFLTKAHPTTCNDVSTYLHIHRNNICASYVHR